MRKLRILALSIGLGLLSALTPSVIADSLSVSCSSSTVSAPASGGTLTIPVNCIINAPNADSSYRITASSNNFMTPSSTSLSSGSNLLTGTLQSSVTSPDSSVTSISGTSSGFTAQMTSSSSPKTLRFQYSVTTTGSTPAGTYSSSGSPPSYHYRVCTRSNCNQEIFSGTATTPISVTVPSAPVTINCTSPTVNATAGGGPFSLTVACTVSSGNPTRFSPSSQNAFSPSTITLSHGSSHLTATLQSTVTSPDSSVSGISGTAGAGFTGNVNALPAKIQATFTGATLNTTPAGTYTSPPVSFTWSTI
jgi:hypothetical protein